MPKISVLDHPFLGEQYFIKLLFWMPHREIVLSPYSPNVNTDKATLYISKLCISK